MVKITYTCHSTNEKVLKRVEEKRMSVEYKLRNGKDARRDNKQKCCWKKEHVQRDLRDVPIKR